MWVNMILEHKDLRWTYFHNLYDFSVINEIEALSAMLGD